MAVFEYKAVEANGAIAEGRIDAGGRQDAVRIIEQRGLTPVRLVETVTAPAAAICNIRLPVPGSM